MDLQIPRLVKAGCATIEIAHMAFCLITVKAPVVLRQLSCINEDSRAATRVAYIRPLSGVYAFMCPHVALPAEGLIATLKAANMSSFARVGELVFLQVT